MISKKLLGRGSIFLLANILNSAIPFFLLPVLTRVLSPEDYGIVAMFSVFLSLMSAFVGLSVHGAINVNYFKFSKNKFSEYITSCLFLLIVSAVSVLSLVAIIGPFIENAIGLPYKWMLIGVVVAFFQFLISIRLTIWVVTGNAPFYGCFQVAQTLLNAGGSLFLILVVGMLWEGRLLAQSLAVIALGLVAILLLCKDQFLSKPTALKEDIKDALKFGLPLIPHVLGAFAIHSSDRIIIAESLDTAMVGIYMVGMQLGMAMSLLSDSFNKVYAPWLMENLENKNNKERLVKNSYLGMLFILATGMLWAAVATFFLPIFVGEKFNASKDIIWIMCLGFSFTGLYYIVTNYIFFTKKTQFLSIITFICGGLNIPLTYYWVSIYGIAGAAYAFLVIQILFFILTWYLSNKVYPMPWFTFFKGKADA